MTNLLFACLLLAACGASGSGEPESEPITFAGQAAAVSIAGMTPLAALDIAAYDRADEVTPIAATTTDQLGNFILELPTGFDGYIRGREADYMDTYLYAPHPLASSYEGAPLRMATAATVGLLTDVCAASQLPNQGTVVAIATDRARMGVAGVTFSSAPASNKYCYNGEDGLPASVQLTTGTDGVGYLFNVVGPVTVNATKPATTFQPRQVTARPGAVTMVLIAP